ncbi:SLAM family member 5-like [Paramisgurnus dabryanus]|uniref:SLAM family member 5-like n=1 Tax=Paramisgurnus dabryanus TaxID=90735 RepID=UPI003CCF60B2
MEGDSVTLHTNITELRSKDVIVWRFGSQGSLIARINREANTVLINADVLDGRFRDRLQMNDQTGDLTITNITTNHTGDYQLTISSNQKTSYKFNVTVYARLPIPVISRISPQNSSSSESSNCSLLCSVLNVRDVSLSWYKGNSLLSIISVSDLNISSIFLHLECLDDSYNCVVNNSISNQTQHLNTDLCQTCLDCFCCCYGPVAVIRLVLSVLVGVAAIAVVVYDIRTRGDEQKKRSQTSDNHQ